MIPQDYPSKKIHIELIILSSHLIGKTMDRIINEVYLLDLSVFLHEVNKSLVDSGNMTG